MKAVSVIVVGAGGRGWGYSNYAKKCPEQVRVVGVAEPRKFHRERVVREHGIAREMTFRTWQALAKQPRLADAVLICTQDAMHEKPVAAFARLGYAILLEKPMAPTARSCRRIVQHVREADVTFAVCHVMRYTNYTRILKQMLVDGLIGTIVNIDHYEPVGFWHQAHSFVRGNWRNEKESSNMLLAKSCHDIDWLSYIMDKPCTRVSSFGSLRHFRRSEQPAGAADRCLECPLADTCVYSAKRFYFEKLEAGHLGWPLDVVDPETTAPTLERALRDGPYGRCVYACDNDVVDNQVVNLQYADGATANFTMTAFNPGGGRKTRIGGTLGYIETHESSVIRHYDFATKQWKEIDTAASDASILGGHGGGDGGVMAAFLHAVATGDRSRILSGPDATLESHMTVFAAEQARRKGRVVELARFNGGAERG
ncbi:MAG: Gfo/Idh/MocA family oxidoreductase [Lentisphaerae bacterium]|nr:Gfo/Idh/MocA family oxidoreductase [Lentisphaerota bacterium]